MNSVLPNQSSKKKRRSNRLFFKLLIVFLLCFMIPVCASCVAFYSISVNVIQKEVENYNHAQLIYLSDKLDDIFSKAKDILCEYSVKDCVNNTHKTGQDILDCMESFRSTMSVNSFIDSMFVYNEADGSVISNNGLFPLETYFTRQYEFSELPFEKLQNLFSANQGFSAVGAEHYSYYITSNQYRETDSVLTLFSYTTGSRRITIGIMISSSAINTLLTGSVNTHNGELYILDRNRKSIVSSEMKIDFNAFLSENPTELNSGVWHNESGEKILYNYMTSCYGMIMINAVPWTEVSKSLQLITRFSVVLAVALVMISLVLSLLLSKQIARPIETVSTNLTQNNISPLKLNGVMGHSTEYMNIYSRINQLQSKNQHLQSVLDDNRDSLRSSLLQGILYADRDTDFLIFRLSELGIRFDYPFFSVVLLKIDLYKNAYEAYSADELKNIRTGVCNLVCLWDYPCDSLLQSVKISEDEFALLINSASDDMEVFSQEFYAISRLIDMENDQARITFAVTHFTDSVRKMSSLFNSAQVAMEYRLINRQSQVVNSGRLARIDNRQYVGIPTNVEVSVTNYITVGDYASAIQLIDAQINSIMKNELPYEYFKHMLSSFVNAFVLALSSRNIPIGDVFDNDPYQELHSLTNVDEIRDFFRYACEKACSYIMSSRKNSTASLQKILQYIQENYQRDFSLEEISRYSGFSSQYFSRYFKEQMGITFTDYVSQLRIQKAKKFLAEPNSLVSTVAYAVGFENVNSFIRMFKRYEGVSPGKYKSCSNKKEIPEETEQRDTAPCTKDDSTEGG